MQGYRIGGGFLNIFLNRSKRGVDCVRFWRQRKIGHGLRQREFPFGSAEKVIRIASRKGNAESLGRSEADVFDCHADNSPCDVERIFAGSEHASEPVSR